MLIYLDSGVTSHRKLVFHFSVVYGVSYTIHKKKNFLDFCTDLVGCDRSIS